MLTNSYKLLAEVMENAFAPIAEFYTETTKASLNTIACQAKELCETIMPVYSPENFNKLASQISDLCNIILLSFDGSSGEEESLSFFETIDFQSEFVELTEEDCNSINSLLELTSVENAPKISPHDRTPTIQFILSIVIPMIIGILQMRQSENHYKLDSIETQNIQAQEQERYEQIMQGMSDIIDSLNELQESQESRPCNHSDVPILRDEVPSDMPDVQSQGDSVE